MARWPAFQSVALAGVLVAFLAAENSFIGFDNYNYPGHRDDDERANALVDEPNEVLLLAPEYVKMAEA